MARGGTQSNSLIHSLIHLWQHPKVENLICAKIFFLLSQLNFICEKSFFLYQTCCGISFVWVGFLPVCVCVCVGNSFHTQSHSGLTYSIRYTGPLKSCKVAVQKLPRDQWQKYHRNLWYILPCHVIKVLHVSLPLTPIDKHCSSKQNPSFLFCYLHKRRNQVLWQFLQLREHKGRQASNDIYIRKCPGLCGWRVLSVCGCVCVYMCVYLCACARSVCVS